MAQVVSCTPSISSSVLSMNTAANAASSDGSNDRPSAQPMLKKASSSTNISLVNGNSNSNGNILDGAGVGIASQASGAAVAGVNSTPSKPQRPARRIEVETLMNEFQRVLGDNWSRYREVMTAFLTGKLTRHELEHELSTILDQSMVRMHNQFLLASLANSLRDPPPSTNGLVAWGKRVKDAPVRISKMTGDPAIARLKSEIMGFTPRERRRIKAITRDAGKKGPPPSTIILTKQARSTKLSNIKTLEKSKANIVQDISQSYQAPLATETYEIPDTDSLRTRILGIAYENGLLDGIASDVPDVILAGLEYHMRDFLQQIFDRVRPKAPKMMSGSHSMSLGSSMVPPMPPLANGNGNNDAVSGSGLDSSSSGLSSSSHTTTACKGGELLSRSRDSHRLHFEDDNIVTAEDMALALELVPHNIVEQSGPYYRLYDVMLRDEIDDYPPPI
ncbi:transcriptional regulator of RNA polII, SAGA, subunit-domain-containing protein [Limtongia smithiae]|uniref:transcriptional regulator of RNA polII, SAGA, subunit-domain-containing protein n=1 Tax=Limtongia smithiae TaxID=1125753 RepID=UPI0034CE9224